MKKLKKDTLIVCCSDKSRYFTKNKIYKVIDSDLRLNRIWCEDDKGFTELLDTGQWKIYVDKSTEWGEW